MSEEPVVAVPLGKAQVRGVQPIDQRVVVSSRAVALREADEVRSGALERIVVGDQNSNVRVGRDERIDLRVDRPSILKVQDRGSVELAEEAFAILRAVEQVVREETDGVPDLQTADHTEEQERDREQRTGPRQPLD